MECKFDLILLRGAPGAGKSTLAHLLKDCFPLGSTIESESVWNTLNRIDWLSKEQSLLAISSSLLLANNFYMEGKKPNILIDVFYGDRATYLIDKIKKDRIFINFCVISLYCTNEDLKNRILRRDKGWKDLKTSLECNETVKNIRCENEILIDTTKCPIGDVYNKVLGNIT